jgi:hypothetical protein
MDILELELGGLEIYYVARKPHKATKEMASPTATGSGVPVTCTATFGVTEEVQ